MLQGLMQNDFPLTLHHPLRRLQTFYSDHEVVTLGDDGKTRATFGEVGDRIDRLGRVLAKLGIERGQRVATLAWNSQRHFELYYALPCYGAVLHTLNIRLFAEQLEYIVNHAEDQAIFVDANTVGTLAPLLPKLSTVRHVIVLGDDPEGTIPGALSYEELLEDAGPGAYDWPEVDERSAAALCYTSGTTGNPKGVLYSHRSISMHATQICMADSIGLSQRDRALTGVPMYHVNAWGFPFAAGLTGFSPVFPTRYLQAEPLARLIEEEKVTVMNAVPTIFSDLLHHADANGTDLSSIRLGVCGGAAVPRSLIERYAERHGVELIQAWGMTETSSISTVAHPPDGVSEDEAMRLRATQGALVPWVEARLVEGDDTSVPFDGSTPGELEVRGPWVASEYFGGESTGPNAGWLRTGDIGTIDPRGYLTITDRAKDLIKSGGEWISSVELENELMAHPTVREAAVIAMPDARWGERPMACVVAQAGAQVDFEELKAFLSERVAKWWIPAKFVLIDEVPKTSTLKFDKKVLREQFTGSPAAAGTVSE